MGAAGAVPGDGPHGAAGDPGHAAVHKQRWCTVQPLPGRGRL